jgi:glucose/arabinose dehydrogenase
MHKVKRTGLLFSLGFVLAVSALAPTAWSDIVLQTNRVATGLDSPLYVTAPPSDPNRLFIVEQHTGAIKILDLQAGVVNAQPFLTVGGLSTGDEQGLLGMAFHPNYANNGLFYVNFSDAAGTTNIREYTRSTADQADPNSARTILTIAQPQSNHNGGWIGFGPDSLLYIASGDGGGSFDSGNGHTPNLGNGQDTSNLLGKILRIDVDGDDFLGDPLRNYRIPADNPFVGQNAAQEIWTFGLRNPWRASFDRATGDLYIGDVGQGSREEIDVQPAASNGGENYGWRPMEGTIETPGLESESPITTATNPIYDYSHGNGPLQGNAVTGGYVYRGPIAELQGMYFFADFINDRVWSLQYDGSDPTTFDGTNFTNFIDWTTLIETNVGTIEQIASFGEDAQGNLYIVDLGGEVYRIQSAVIPEPGAFALLLFTSVGVVCAVWIKKWWNRQALEPVRSCGVCEARGEPLTGVLPQGTFRAP